MATFRLHSRPLLRTRGPWQVAVPNGGRTDQHRGSARFRVLTVVSDNGTVHQHDDPALVSGPADRLALYRSRKADAERLHRELQRQLPR